jgi:hypothetical protein
MKVSGKLLGVSMTFFVSFQILLVCSLYAQMVIDSDDWSQFNIAAGTPLIGYTKPFSEPRSPGPTTSQIFEGHVSFGTPVVTTAKEEGMMIPRSLTQRGEVYIVRFAVSFAKIHLKIIEQLSFSVTGTANMIALELIPFKFDKETSITKTVSSPNIKIKYGENAVELGEFYKKQVVYKVLKPTIVANGLQESTFAWYMTDDAVHQGANQFIAILLVPKKEKSLTVNLEAGAKTKPTWIAQGNAIATPSMPVKIELK